MPSRRELNIWRDIKKRCYIPTSKYYRHYGAKGVTMCPQWRASFAQFLRDMGPAPSPGHWLVRKDVAGNYCPENCEWAPPSRQMARRKCARLVQVDGQTMLLSEAERLPGMPSRATIKRRLAKGLPLRNPPAAP